MLRALSEKARTSSVAQPLGADEFSSLAASFAPFSADYRFAIAVSGGPDSMALAYGAKRWSDASGYSAVALIVDHGLRPESADEAAAVRARLAAIGLEAEILRWEHAPVLTRLHATARKARYRLLADACRRRGIRDLWLAHQREDQAETILMRLSKGSGIDGLAGMGTEGTFEDLRLLRPLLAVSKERLIATCREAGISFVEDQSNASDKFARGRLRRAMPLLAEEGLSVERLTDLGARAADVKDALEYYTLGFLRESSSRDEAGVIRIERAALRAAPREIAGRALESCLHNIHAENYATEHESLIRLANALRADNEMPPRTLHGCLVSKTPTHVAILREVSGITETPVINPGQNVIWDGRWRVSLDAKTSGSFTIRPLGSPSHETLDTLAPGLRKRVPQGRARAGIPTLWQGETLALIPSLGDESPAQARLVSPWPPG